MIIGTQTKSKSINLYKQDVIWYFPKFPTNIFLRVDFISRASAERLVTSCYCVSILAYLRLSFSFFMVFSPKNYDKLRTIFNFRYECQVFTGFDQTSSSGILTVLNEAPSFASIPNNIRKSVNN